LSWKSCIFIWKDGAPSVRKPERICRTGQQKNPGIVFTYCFLHRETLIWKSEIPEVQKVLDETIKWLTNQEQAIKIEAVFSTVFYHGSCSQLLLHMEVGWLSQRWVLSKFYKLRENL
jgi:hypothetical protein